MLTLANLAGLADRQVDELSRGDAQRLRFACALTGNPDLLVLDEPTVAMDVESRRTFWDSMRRYAATGRTILFSTHYLEEADAVADRIVVIARGQLVADGSGADIRKAAGGRTISFDLNGMGSDGLDTLPGVLSVDVRGERVMLRSTDSDAAVAQLIAERGRLVNLEVTAGGLEDAFVALTSASPTPGAPR